MSTCCDVLRAMKTMTPSNIDRINVVVASLPRCSCITRNITSNSIITSNIISIHMQISKSHRRFSSKRITVVDAVLLESVLFANPFTVRYGQVCDTWERVFSRFRRELHELDPSPNACSWSRVSTIKSRVLSLMVRGTRRRRHRMESIID